MHHIRHHPEHAYRRHSIGPFAPDAVTGPATEFAASRSGCDTVTQRIIIDTDPGVDDVLALIFALHSPELRVHAITTVAGNVDVEQATRNAAVVVDLVAPHSRPLLARGAARPLHKDPVTAHSVHGDDGLGNVYSFTHPDGAPRYAVPDLSPDLPSATEVVFDLIAQYPEEIILIALGPLTNVALLLHEDPHRLARLRGIVAMGGAVAVPGNITPVAEFNVFADPEAAQRVFAAGLPLTLVPLDSTRQVLLRTERFQALSGAMAPPLGSFLRGATRGVMAYMQEAHGIDGIYLHDPLAVGVVIDPSLVTTQPLRVNVETSPGITEGMTVADRRALRASGMPGPKLKVALDVASERFLRLFEERLCRMFS
jgi:purine nucleosidase/pyrimidine-specific ribonucleoside hydrolase